MTDGPVTRPSLLVRIRNAADTEAWSQFVRLYVPLVHGLARRRGLQGADADDLTQEVFQKVSAAVDRLEYDLQRGSFRSWLFTVSCHCLHDFLQRRARQCSGAGSSGVQALLEEYPATDADISRSSGRPVVFGDTSTGRHLLVLYEEIDADTVYPVTAYDVPRRQRP